MLTNSYKGYPAGRPGGMQYISVQRRLQELNIELPMPRARCFLNEIERETLELHVFLFKRGASIVLIPAAFDTCERQADI
jgi:hypothetical protein